MWQINVIRRTISTSSVKESGLKPFVYTKAKAAIKNYEKNELEDIATQLLECLLLSRSGKISFEDRFEEIISSI